LFFFCLTGIDGMVITGANMTNFLGQTVSHTKDFNGDGVEDIIIGATLYSLISFAVGKSYIIYGTGPNIFKDGFE